MRIPVLALSLEDNSLVAKHNKPKQFIVNTRFIDAQAWQAQVCSLGLGRIFRLFVVPNIYYGQCMLGRRMSYKTHLESPVFDEQAFGSPRAIEYARQ